MSRTHPAAPRALLPARLLGPSCYPHPVRRIHLVETHISWVLLTGDYAYKIKKPVDLGFLDFTTLERRRRACEEELRLNRRLAPELYLEVVAIRGSAKAPRIGGKGPLIEYAVKMREFHQETLASRALAAGRFGTPEVDTLADSIAAFHAAADPAPPGSRFGTPQAVLFSADQNFEQMLGLTRASADRRTLHALAEWTRREHAARSDALEARKSAGHIQACHGDLHLGNVVLIDRRPVPFDGIEFSDELRFIDVMSDVAFLFMDLADRGRPDLSWRFVNRYLEDTGDHGGLEVLRFYAVYRALVRAKVHLIRAHQPGLAARERARLTRAFRGYLRLARTLATPATPAVIITHGLSGCGKTTASQSLIETLGAIRVRSDVERKRLHGFAPVADTASAPGRGIYSRTATAATYRRLGQLAGDIVRAGYPAVVDAAFLRRTEREAFRALADRLDVPFVILDFHAPLALLRERVAARRALGNDASEADLSVLERQIAWREPLTPAEMAAAIVVDGTRAPPPRTWRAVMERLRQRRHRARSSARGRIQPRKGSSRRKSASPRFASWSARRSSGRQRRSDGRG